VTSFKRIRRSRRNSNRNRRSGGKRGCTKFGANALRPIIVVVIVLTTFRSAIADWNDVPTGSMKPTIIEGDRIFVNKLAYGLKVPFTTWHLARWNTPARGEIVVFNSPEDGVRLVKRVVGLPGDKIQMIDNRLYINGQPVEDEAVDSSFINALAEHRAVDASLLDRRFGSCEAPDHEHARDPAMRTFGPLTVPEGHYFMMGDKPRQQPRLAIFSVRPRGQHRRPLVARGALTGLRSLLRAEVGSVLQAAAVTSVDVQMCRSSQSCGGEQV
jgi:signal peptidase I